MSALVCQPCKDEGIELEASGYCLDCCDYLCEDCYQTHCKPRPTRNHKLLDKEQMLQEQSTLPTKAINDDTCSNHSTETVKYFCPKHDVVGCSICITIEHRSCVDVVDIPQVCGGIVDSEEYKDFQKDIEETSKRFENIIPLATENISKSEASNANVNAAIGHFKEDIDAAIKRLETAARRDVEQIKTDDTKRMKLAIEQSKNALKKLEVMSSNMRHLERIRREPSLFIAIKQNNRDKSEMQEDLTEWENNNTVRVCRFEGNLEISKFLGNVDCLGEILDKVKYPLYNIESSSTDDTENANYTEISQITIKATYLRDIYIKSDDEKVLYCSVESVAVSEKDKVVVVENALTECNPTTPIKEIELHDESYYNNFKKTYLFKPNTVTSTRVKLVDTIRKRIISELVLPGTCYGMTKITENQIAICYNHEAIILMRVDTCLIVERRLASWSCGSNCSVSCFRNEIYACKEDCRIMKIELNSTITTDKTVEKQKFHASARHVRKDEIYLYAIVKDDKGPLYLGYGANKEMSKDKVNLPTTPSFITMDDDGRVLFVLTDDGIFVVRAGTTDAQVLLGKDDGVFNVSAIAYRSCSKQLVVAFKDSNFIKLYQLSGMPQHDR